MINSYLAGRSILKTLPLLFVLMFVIGFTSVKAVTIYGVTTGNQLVRFDSATPGMTMTVGSITGMQPGENLVGLDFRPLNGQLYGLGSTSRLYVINRLTGVATAVGTAGGFTLSGTNFGFNFNPTVDRIRVVGNTGQNLRLNPDTGALAAIDTNLNPGTPNVTGAAYTNSFAGSTTTVLYDIDSTTNSLYTQNPPNNGTLNLVGALGVVMTGVAGFDIAPFGGISYSVMTVGGASRLYTINLTTGTATLVGSVGNGTNELRAISVTFGSAAASVVDYDGDRRTDYSVFRPSQAMYFVNPSSNANAEATIYTQFGLSTDVQTPGDYDGDGKTDYAVWRSSTGVFYVLRSSDSQVQYFQFGQNGDEPVARDYDGDGKTDFAVVRRSGSALVWYIANSTSGSVRVEQFGTASDVATPGDYDGDGRFDLSVYRNRGDGQGVFYSQRSTAGLAIVQFGLASDLVVPGDYDGDGKTDYAVVRDGTIKTWYVLRSSDSTVTIRGLGTKSGYTVQGDYDGDGRTDFAVWDQITGNYSVVRSGSGLISQFHFGINGDFPVANYDTH